MITFYKEDLWLLTVISFGFVYPAVMFQDPWLLLWIPFFWLNLAALWLFNKAQRRKQAAKAEAACVASRADNQHQALAEADLGKNIDYFKTGIYGNYQPADLDWKSIGL